MIAFDRIWQANSSFDVLLASSVSFAVALSSPDTSPRQRTPPPGNLSKMSKLRSVSSLRSEVPAVSPYTVSSRRFTISSNSFNFARTSRNSAACASGLVTLFSSFCNVFNSPARIVNGSLIGTHPHCWVPPMLTNFSKKGKFAPSLDGATNCQISAPHSRFAVPRPKPLFSATRPGPKTARSVVASGTSSNAFCRLKRNFPAR